MAPEELTEAPELTGADKSAIVGILLGALGEEKYARRQEVVSARRQRFYDRGDQYIWYDQTAYVFKSAEESGESLPTYRDVYNIYSPHRRSLVSVLSQNPPGVNFLPDEISVSRDVTAANRAEKMRHRVDRDIRMKDLQTQAARYFCTDARVIFWSRVKDGKAICSAHAVLESKVPIYTEKMEEWGYAILARERDADSAKEDYQDVADKIVPSSTSGEASFERMARLGVLGGTRSLIGADTNGNLVTEYTAWFRPARYRKLPAETQKKVKALYPKGFRVAIISDTVCEMESDVMDDALSVAFPSPGDGQNRPSLLKDLVDLQDAFNDGMNMARECFDYGIPALWANSKVIDAEAIPEQRSEPGVMHMAEWNPSSPLTDAFFQEAPAILPPALFDWLKNLSGQLSQFITGDLPSLFGGSMEDVETAKGYSMAREQAMGGLSPAWGAMQGLFAKSYKQLIIALANSLGDEEISIPGDGGKNESFKASELLVGNFGCYPDTDSSFPETTAAKRAAFQNFTTQIAQLEGGQQIVTLPDNLKLGLQLSGLEDFKIPGAEARDKQLREIAKLLREQPIGWKQYQEAQLAAAQGVQVQPPQMQTTVPVDEQWDYHQAEADKVQEWLSSDERVQEERKGNLAGIENVKLHGMAHRDALAKQQGQPAGKPPSVSISYKDVADPAAKAQILQEAGIQTSPDALEEAQGKEDAMKAVHKVI